MPEATTPQIPQIPAVYNPTTDDLIKLIAAAKESGCSVTLSGPFGHAHISPGGHAVGGTVAGPAFLPYPFGR